MNTERAVPIWVRLWHWITAILFISLTITGAVLHFATPNFTLIDYAAATTLHDIGGILLAVFYGIYLLMLIGTGYWRQYIPARQGLWKRLMAQVAYYSTGMARDKPGNAVLAVGTRFNALQQLTYFFVVFGLLPLLVVTGLIYLYPQYVPREVLVGLGGLWPVALAHYVVGILGAAYLIVHIYIATSSPDAGADFRLMTTGRAESAEKS
jgi:thiosulfate reductase cytochrome b subunit